MCARLCCSTLSFTFFACFFFTHGSLRVLWIHFSPKLTKLPFVSSFFVRYCATFWPFPWAKSQNSVSDLLFERAVTEIPYRCAKEFPSWHASSTAPRWKCWTAGQKPFTDTQLRRKSVTSTSACDLWRPGTSSIPLDPSCFLNIHLAAAAVHGF